jgi:ABC-type branched-subunit amino acid transport system substrate-binding protein
MKKKIIWSVIIVIVIILLVVFEINKNNKPDNVKIGLIAPLTGDFSMGSDEILNALKDNLPNNYTLIAEDDQCDPKKTISTFNKLIDVDKVKYIIGPYCGGSQEVLIPLIKNKDVILVLPTSADEGLFERSNNKVFGVQYSIQDESAFMAKTMNDLNYKNIGLVSYNNSFSILHTNSFKEEFKGDINEIKYTDFSSDIKSELLKFKNTQIDVFYITDLSFFLSGGLQKLRELGFKQDVYSTYLTALPMIKEIVGGVKYSYPEDIKESLKGPSYEFSLKALEILSEKINKCIDRFDCVLKETKNSKDFNENGIRFQTLIIKEIN